MNFSWNGFGYEGSIAVGEMIRGNKYLRELDVSNNRINWEGAIHIAKGLKENDTLEVLQVKQVNEKSRPPPPLGKHGGYL